MRRLPSAPCLSRPEFAAEQPTRERAPDEKAKPLRLDQGYDLPLDIAASECVVVLRRRDLRQVEPFAVANGSRHLPGRPVRHADITHQTLPHEHIESCQAFLDRRHGIDIVQLIEVDVVDLQPSQAPFDAVYDMRPRIACLVWTCPHRSAHLGGDDHVFAPDTQVLERPAENFLGDAAGIDVGGIYEVDAMVEGTRDQALSVFLLDIAHVGPDSLAAEGHRPEAKLRNEKTSISERVIFHDGLLRVDGEVSLSGTPLPLFVARGAVGGLPSHPRPPFAEDVLAIHPCAFLGA